MKKKLVVLLMVIALLFVVACGSNNENGEENDYPENEAIETTNNEDEEPELDEPELPEDEEEPELPEDEPETYENSPADTISAFFRYLASGNVRAADAIFAYSDGGFAFMAEDMYDELGTFVFSNISISNLDYTVSGSTATATFVMENVNFFTTAYEAGYEIGFAIAQEGLIALDDPDFEALVEEMVMPRVAEMIIENRAPMFEIETSIDLRLVDNVWRIIDNDVSFAMALLGLVDM